MRRSLAGHSGQLAAIANLGDTVWVAAWFWASEASRPSSRLLTVAPWLASAPLAGLLLEDDYTAPWQRAAGGALGQAATIGLLA